MTEDTTPAKAPTDDLLTRWQGEEDREALGELLFRELGMIKRVLRARGVSGDIQASDIAQDAVAKLLSMDGRVGMPRFESPGGLRGYLLKTAWNLCVMRYRQSGREPLSLEAGETHGFWKDPSTLGGIDAVDRSDFDLALLLTLNVLPHTDQEILRLFYIDGASVNEIAEKLDLTPEATRVRKMRALRKLSERMQGWWEVLQE